MRHCQTQFILILHSYSVPVIPLDQLPHLIVLPYILQWFKSVLFVSMFAWNCSIVVLLEDIAKITI